MSAGRWVEPASVGAGEACLGATRALCNRCGALTDAKVAFVGDTVQLVKWCPTHGETRALVSSDAGWYRRSLSYLKPGTDPKRRAVEEHRGCPDSCGLCPAHQQHTCVPILELTSSCDLDCPICLVEGRLEGTMSLDEVRHALDDLVAAEGRVNMLTLSGGEPTLHPEFERIVELAQRPEIGVVSVSTNGVRLARDERLLRFLCDRGVVVSLQFDGARPETWARLRGDPGLGEKKLRLIERILELGGRVSLTTTLSRGVNEDELGEVLKVLFSHDRVLSLMVQPEARMRPLPEAGLDAVLDAITIPEVVARLAAASGGALREADFTPLPCSHPSCFALTYLLKLDDGRLVSLPSLIDAEAYIDLTKNQALLNTDADSLLRIKDALYEVWTASGAIPQRDAILGAIRRVLLEVNRLGPAAGHRALLEVGMRNVKSIFIHQFMDRYSFDLSRVVKCCNHYPQADGRLVPACVRNNLRLLPAAR